MIKLILNNALAISAVTIILSCALTGCRDTAPVTETSDYRYIPRGLGKTLPSSNEPAAFEPRFDGVYVNASERGGSATYYSWFRFWPNNRVIRRGDTMTPPDREDAEDFSGGLVGRYKVLNKTLFVEFYEPVDDQRQFVTYRGEPLGDGIKFTKVYFHDGRFWLRHTRSVSFYIKFKPIGSLQRMSDW